MDSNRLKFPGRCPGLEYHSPFGALEATGWPIPRLALDHPPPWRAIMRRQAGETNDRFHKECIHAQVRADRLSVLLGRLVRSLERGTGRRWRNRQGRGQEGNEKTQAGQLHAKGVSSRRGR